MTQCPEQLAFSFHQSTQVVGDFKGGLITSDAGLLALRELDHRLGWTEQVAALLADDRQAGKVEFDTLTLLRQRFFALLAGYEDANDHTRLRYDPLLKTVTGRRLDDPLASQPTLCRFENCVTARQVAELNRLLVHQFIQRQQKKRPKRLILDLDPTDDPCHGHQQLALFNGFYDQYMYLPLLVFERTTGMLLGVRLRAGTVSAPQGLIPLLRPILAALRRKWPTVEILLRLDAGFAAPWVYQFCERERLGYLIGLPSNAVLEARTAWALRWIAQRFDQDHQPHRHRGGFRYQARTWDHPRRVLYKVEVHAEGTNRRFVVTNLQGLPHHLWPLYEDRGTAETFIDDLKNGLAMDRLSCERFVANAFRLILAALAYNLLCAFRGTLAGTELEHASILTIRTRLVKIGARLEQTARRIWVHLSSAFPLREVLAQALAAIQALPPVLPSRPANLPPHLAAPHDGLLQRRPREIPALTRPGATRFPRPNRSGPHSTRLSRLLSSRAGQKAPPSRAGLPAPCHLTLVGRPS
jgi:hypothetical protein